MTEEELYNEYRKNNCKSFTDFLINKIAELKKEVLEVRQHLDLTEKEWGKDLTKMYHYKTQSTKAKEIILRLYNAGRDVLMCRAEEKAYDNLSNAINDKSIEQFLSEVKK